MTEQLEVSVSTKANVLAYNNFTTIELGFEIIDWEDEGEDNIGGITELISDKRTVKQTSTNRSGEVKHYTFVETRLSYIERVLWRFVPKFMAHRERETIINHFSRMGIEVRELGHKELESVLLPSAM